MGTLADKIAYLKGTRDLQQEYLNSQGRNVTNATPFRKFLEEFKALQSNSGFKTIYHQGLDHMSVNKSVTIPATAKEAIISVDWIKTDNTPDPVISLTVSKGSITNMDGTALSWEKDGWGSPGSYSSTSIIYKNFRKKFKNTTGQACTFTFNVSSDYGLLGANILVVY